MSKDPVQISGVGFDREEGMPIINVMPADKPDGTPHPRNILLWIETEDGEAAIELTPKARKKLRDLL